jgi:hypothetical protein
MTMTMPLLGLSEQEYRDQLERELVLAMRAEGGAPTIHAIAHAVARVAEVDHLRIAEQLRAAGVPIGPETVRPPGSGRGWPMD